MNYGRHTSKEFNTLALVIVLVWLLTHFFTPQLERVGTSIKNSSVTAILGR